ncbi:MAG: ABC transporter permease subunit [Gemmataceae bacterium]
MSLPAAVNVVRGLIWETFWQAVASRIFWVMLAVSACCILFCAGVRVHGGARQFGEDAEFLPASQFDPKKVDKTGVVPIQGQISFGFGAVHVSLGRDVDDAVRFVELVLSSIVAGTLGVLLTLIWTAGFLPSFLEPNAASVLLTKPVPRWLLLLGKFLGVNLFVGLQAAVFVFGTWFTLGLTTGVWAPSYLLTVPLLMLQFSFFYSFSMFLAVATRSTVVCIVGTVLFWALCSAVNAGRVEMVAAGTTSWPLEIAYWLLPKPVDCGVFLRDALDAGRYFAQWEALKEYRPGEASVVTSVLSAAALLLLAAVDFRKVDY